ncbi:MAG: ABC transporter permease [Actinomycetota bacterium]|nr:ABC transporter permease [Actinomycetota bacterium]
MPTALSTLVTQVNLRHARRRRLRTLLTVGGIAAGVMLAVSISLINATLLSSIRESARQLAGAAEIEVSASDSTGMQQDVATKIASVEGVEKAVPMLRNYTTVRAGERDARILVTGVTPEIASLFPTGLGKAGEVEMEGGFGLGAGVVLSETTAASLDLKIGDRAEIETPSGFTPIEITGTATGGPLAVFNGGEVGSMLLPAAQELFRRTGFIDSVYVVVDEQAGVAETESAVREVVGQNPIVGPPGTRGTGFADALNGINAITAVAGTVALFVAGFVVFNTMSMSLAERRREIAMTLVFGATRKQIFLSFVAEALVLGAVAAAVGVAAGIALAWGLVDWALEGLRVFNVTANVPLQISPASLLVGGLSGIAVALAGALLPARRVLSVAPVQALRRHASFEWTSARVSKRARVARTALGIALMVASAFVLTVQVSDPERIQLFTNTGLLLGLVGTTLLLPALVPIAIEALKPPIERVFRAPGALAIDALRKNPGRTTVTAGALIFTLGIAIGVSSALTSYEKQWNRSAGMWFGAPLYVQPESFDMLGADQPLPADVTGVLENVPGVRAALPERYRVVNIDGRQTTLYVIPYDEAVRTDAKYTHHGDVFREMLGKHFARGHVVISRYMAKQRDLGPGDAVEIPTPSGTHAFTVGGLVDDLNPLDAMYIEGEDFVELWGVDAVDRFEIIPHEGANLADVTAALERTIAERELTAQVIRRDDLIGGLFDEIQRTFSVANAIQIDALIIAALAIANTMFIAIYERRWELGLQQTLGMSRRQMAGSLLLEAGVIGIVGGAGATLLGLAIGFLMLQGMVTMYAFTIPFEPSWSLAAVAFTVGVVLAALAGLYPTRMAVKVPIIESLRYE